MANPSPTASLDERALTYDELVARKDAGGLVEWSSQRASVWSDRPWNAEGKQLALVHRPDIRSFGSGPSTYGFVADVRAATFTTEVGHELTIVATGVDGSVFRCPVVLSSVAGRTSWDGPFPLADGVLHL